MPNSILDCTVGLYSKNPKPIETKEIKFQRQLENVKKAKNKTYRSRVDTPALHVTEVSSCLQPHQRIWKKKGPQALSEVREIESHMFRNSECAKRVLTMATSLLTFLVQVKNRAVKTHLL
jgi:hypothetical protein